jgi:hypothetical protein
MKSIHLVITDLFLPPDFAAEVCAGLSLPALEKLLARGKGGKGNAPASPESGGQLAHPTQADLSVSLEEALCGLFAVPGAPVAAISAAFDGLGEGSWLRADPVHLRLQRDQVVLLPNVAVSAEEAVQLCDSLNEHFAGQGLDFFAPHPQRWYLRLAAVPDIQTIPLSQAAGRNIHGNLPTGADSRRWHQLFNEIQMLLFAHPLNEAREARGEAAINSLWLWGQGAAVPVQSAYHSASSDETLAQMLATSAGLPFVPWRAAWGGEAAGRQLLVWTGLRQALQRGDLASWREALQAFEVGYAQPLWHALCSGKISQLQLDVLGGDSLHQWTLTRGDAWSVWRSAKPLAAYSAVST